GIWGMKTAIEVLHATSAKTVTTGMWCTPTLYDNKTTQNTVNEVSRVTRLFTID
ncbi:hypothetical protein J6590_083409, partial [Homalodisca vitripennis]